MCNMFIKVSIFQNFNFDIQSHNNRLRIFKNKKEHKKQQDNKN